jgi:hypothetical protein
MVIAHHPARLMPGASVPTACAGPLVCGASLGSGAVCVPARATGNCSVSSARPVEGSDGVPRVCLASWGDVMPVGQLFAIGD